MFPTTRRGYSSLLKHVHISKANASSYTRKPANSISSSTSGYASRYRKVSPASSNTSTAASLSSTPEIDTYHDVQKNEFIESPPPASKSLKQASEGLDNPSTIDAIFPNTLGDNPETLPVIPEEIDWTSSFYGLGATPFPKEAQEILAKPLNPADIEIKPDGLVFLPEIKYRRVLNQAFGAGGWGLAPRSPTIVTDSLITREYALICLGRLVSIVRGEQDYFAKSGIPTATEGCRSNALMRCCKDLGIASELWDPVFIKEFKTKWCEDKFVEHVTTKRVKKIWKRKDRQVEYPYKVNTNSGSGSGSGSGSSGFKY